MLGIITTNRKLLLQRYIIKRLLTVYRKIFGTRSYGGDGLASSCILRHMNSGRIFYDIQSITYKYLHVCELKIVFGVLMALEVELLVELVVMAVSGCTYILTCL